MNLKFKAEWLVILCLLAFRGIGLPKGTGVDKGRVRSQISIVHRLMIGKASAMRDLARPKNGWSYVSTT